jgi:hypothetical protein
MSDSFLSIVQSHDDSKILLVRARYKGNIERVFTDAKVTRTLAADYLYRAFVTRVAAAGAIAEQVNRIGYPNFKDSVRDTVRHDAYTRCWKDMVAWQRQTGGTVRKD